MSFQTHEYTEVGRHLQTEGRCLYVQDDRTGRVSTAEGLFEPAICILRSMIMIRGGTTAYSRVIICIDLDKIRTV